DRLRDRRHLQPSRAPRGVPCRAAGAGAPPRRDPRRRQRVHGRYRRVAALPRLRRRAPRPRGERRRRRRVLRRGAPRPRGGPRVAVDARRRHDRVAGRARRAARDPRAAGRGGARAGGAAGEQGRLARRRPAPDERPGSGPPRPRPHGRRRAARAPAAALDDVRLAARAPRRGRPPRPAAGALLHLERRPRVDGPDPARRARLPRARQRRRAPHEGAAHRDHRRRPALLLPRAQHALHAAGERVGARGAPRARARARHEHGGVPAARRLPPGGAGHGRPRGARRAAPRSDRQRREVVRV
ncbi:MAG: hypothetical protein AVDCRST_MAG30-4522, partial [uncultured Solirubrobacteraceae bacterium]